VPTRARRYPDGAVNLADLRPDEVEQLLSLKLVAN
jgi:hypothetical protein